MQIKVQLKLNGVEGLTKSVQNRIMRESLVEVGNRWHEKYLKRHFTHRGAQIYGYGARSGEPGSGRGFKRSYTAWKKKNKGHTDPLVKSGRGKREALANRIVKARISSKAKRAICTVTLPRVFNFNLRRTGKSKTNANEEIRRVTKAELRDLENYFVEVLSRKYEKAGRTVSSDIKSFRG